MESGVVVGSLMKITRGCSAGYAVIRPLAQSRDGGVTDSEAFRDEGRTSIPAVSSRDTPYERVRE